MNLLVINGSPKGGGSNSYQLTEAFLAGMEQTFQNIQTRKLLISLCFCLLWRSGRDRRETETTLSGMI